MRTSRCLSVFVFVLASAAPAMGDYEQTFKLAASDAASYDEFGYSVAISRDSAIVGAPYDNHVVFHSAGSVYIFDVTTGSERHKLTASDAAPYDFFGRSVAISRDRAIVGAEGNDDAGSHSGSAYIFDVSTGAQLHKLTASDAAYHDYFGLSVAISGDRAIVGAHGNDSYSGSAYLFDTTTGSELFKLAASDAYYGDEFGWSVGISGNRAIVGARYDDDAGSNSGSAYIFDVTTGSELFKLTASDAASGDYFGYAVAISGNKAIVGAPYNDDAGHKSGSAYIFDVTTGSEFFKLTASDAASQDEFGHSVAISGNVEIVGAHGNDDAGYESGSAYIFDVPTGSEFFKLTADDAYYSDYFGYCVGVSPGTAIVGAFRDDDAGYNSGSAYLFNVGLEVLIDIKPCSEVNPINLQANGVLPVAILGSQDLDVSEIDQATLVLGGASPAERGNSGKIGAFEDVNGDGFLDLMLRFPITDLSFDAGATEALLTGNLLDGTAIEGSDLVRLLHPGDANDDGLTNLQDFSILKSNFGLKGKLADGDFNEDGTVNLADFSILKTYFGQSAPTTAIPEPGTMLLLAVAGLAMIRLRRR